MYFSIVVDRVYVFGLSPHCTLAAGYAEEKFAVACKGINCGFVGIEFAAGDHLQFLLRYGQISKCNFLRKTDDRTHDRGSKDQRRIRSYFGIDEHSNGEMVVGKRFERGRKSSPTSRMTEH